MPTPYALSSDLVSAWPAKSLEIATYLDTSLAAKTDLAMTQNAQTGTSYSYVLLDAAKLLTMNNAASNTVTVTKQATVTWVTGTQLRVMNLGAGVTTLVADTGVTINGNKALSQYQGGTLIRTASDVWLFVPTSSAAGVLQVKSTAKTDTFTMSSATLADVTGLTVSITPSSALNLVLVTVHLTWNADVNSQSLQGAIFRGSTQIALGDAAGSRTRRTWTRVSSPAGAGTGSLSMTFLDTPATTASTAYKLQIASDQAGAIYVNRGTSDTDSVTFARGISTITAMEVTP